MFFGKVKQDCVSYPLADLIFKKKSRFLFEVFQMQNLTTFQIRSIQPKPLEGIKYKRVVEA
jgi:hypothetical protein